MENEVLDYFFLPKVKYTEKIFFIHIMNRHVWNVTKRWRNIIDLINDYPSLLVSKCQLNTYIWKNTLPQNQLRLCSSELHSKDDIIRCRIHNSATIKAPRFQKYRNSQVLLDQCNATHKMLKMTKTLFFFLVIPLNRERIFRICFAPTRLSLLGATPHH